MACNDSNSTESTEPKTTDTPKEDAGCAASFRCPEDCFEKMKEHKFPLTLAAMAAAMGGGFLLGRRKTAKGGCPCG